MARRVKKAKTRRRSAEDMVAEVSEAERRKFQATVKALRDQVKEAQSEVDDAHKRAGILDLLRGAGKGKKIRVKKPARGELVAVAPIGDVHAEERVDPSTVNGMNSYDLDTCSKRLDRLAQGILDRVDLLRAKNLVRRLIVPLLGDLITGYIHEENLENNQLSPTQATLFSIQKIGDLFQALLDLGDFGEILVPCSYGNHGRTGKRIKHAAGFKNSFEWLGYHVLAERFKEDTRIRFKISNGYLNPVEVFPGYVMRCHHGDAIRYFGGVGGLTIPTNKSLDAWNQQGVAQLDVFGHYHQIHDDKRFIVNGSVIGWNAFAIAFKCKFERPAQVFFALDPNYGKRWVDPIVLD